MEQKTVVGKGPMITRRSFLGSMVAAGVGTAFLSPARSAKGDGWVQFSDGGDLTDQQLIEAYRRMLTIRWYDREVFDRNLTKRGYMTGTLPHGSPGEEAIGVAVGFALKRTDWIVGTHRPHAHALGKGADLKATTAEILFRQGGTNKACGGTMHLCQKDVGMLGEDGIVGSSSLIGPGAAFGALANGKGEVVVAFTGDGAMSSQHVYTGLTNASRLKLPYICILENNGYASTVGTPQMSNPHLSEFTSIPRGLNVPAYTVDGQDFIAVYALVKQAVDRARAGEGPTFIEAKTYRYYDHNGVAGVKPGVLGAFGLSYRPDREVRHWIDRDPIAILRRTLVTWGVLEDAAAAKIEDEVRKEVADTYDWAEKLPNPQPEAGMAMVFRSGPPILPRQLASCPLYEGFKPVV